MAATTVTSKAARKAQTIRHGNTILKFGASLVESLNGVSSAAGFGPLPSSGCRSSALAMASLRLLPSCGMAAALKGQGPSERGDYQNVHNRVIDLIVPTLE